MANALDYNRTYTLDIDYTDPDRELVDEQAVTESAREWLGSIDGVQASEIKSVTVPKLHGPAQGYPVVRVCATGRSLRKIMDEVRYDEAMVEPVD